MRRLVHIIVLGVMAVITAGCDIFCNPTVEKRMALLYVAATETSLSPYASGNITDMLAGYVPEKGSQDQELLVFFQDRNSSSSTLRSEATLSRYYKNSAGTVMQEVIATYNEDFNACDPESFAQVLATAEATCSPTHRALLFSSHGTGWLPVGYFDGPGERSGAKLQVARESIGYDAKTKDEIDIVEFASVLGNYHWEALLMDCCYMGAVEVAYQLKNSCDWIIASPTEILIQGFPYTVILDNLFNKPGREGLEYISQKYYELYQSQSGGMQSGTIALIDCRELDALSDICANIVAESREAMESVNRLGVQHYFYNSRKDYFFDLAHYFEQFASASRYAQLAEQLDKAVPYKNSTEEFLGLAIEHYSGLSSYIPNPSYPTLNAYYKSLEWNKKVKVIE